jgi:hypothetical protein
VIVKKIKNLKPFFFENSKIPVFLSRFAPIEINAINLGPFVFSRGEISKSTKNHETIHFQQQIELLFLMFYVFYFLYWLAQLISGKSGAEAYRNIPFEKEAYSNQDDYSYLQDRSFFSWLKYRK